MRYIASRLCGLLNRKIAAYKQLSEEMLNERKALLSRDIGLLRESLDKQQRIVDEIYDIMRDYDEEVEALFKQAGLPRRANGFIEQKLLKTLGKDGTKMKLLSKKFKSVVKKARQINRENEKILEVSHSFFQSYMHCLHEIRSNVFGYTKHAKSDDRATENLLINQQY